MPIYPGYKPPPPACIEMNSISMTKKSVLISTAMLLIFETLFLVPSDIRALPPPPYEVALAQGSKGAFDWEIRI